MKGIETINQAYDRIICKQLTHSRILKLTAIVCARMQYGGNSVTKSVDFKKVKQSKHYQSLTTNQYD